MSKRKVDQIVHVAKQSKIYRTPLTHPKLQWPAKDPRETETIFLDEAGRGPLVSTMSIAGVMLRSAPCTPTQIFQHGIDEKYIKEVFKSEEEAVSIDAIGVNDSKKMKEHERERAFEQLIKCPDIYYHIEHITAEEIDEQQLGPVWKNTMKKVVDRLQELSGSIARQVIVDGNVGFNFDLPITEIVKEPKADGKFR